MKVDIVVGLGVKLCAKNNVEVKTGVDRSSAIYCTVRLTMNIVHLLIELIVLGFAWFILFIFCAS